MRSTLGASVAVAILGTLQVLWGAAPEWLLAVVWSCAAVVAVLVEIVEWRRRSMLRSA